MKIVDFFREPGGASPYWRLNKRCKTQIKVQLRIRGGGDQIRRQRKKGRKRKATTRRIQAK